MVYARQINPEYQESPLYIGAASFWPDGLTICGNRDYRERWDENFKRVYDALENGELADALDDFERYGKSDWYKNKTEAIMDLLPPAHKGRYSTREVKALCELIPEYGMGRNRWGRDDDDVLCDVAAVVLGKRYEKRTIRGCCQRDWNYVFYPADEWSREELDNFETEYFNTGTEWMVHDEAGEPDDPEDITGWTVYCHDWDNEGIRKEIADAAGCKPEDVIMYAIIGTRKVTVCEYGAV